MKASAPSRTPSRLPQETLPGNTGAPSYAVRDGFDHAAAGYDENFSDSLVGRLQREAVWRRLDRLFSPGAHVLDLGCGTGTDAIHLAKRGVRVNAVDISSEMIAVADRKIKAAGLAAKVTTSVQTIETLNPAHLCEQIRWSALPARERAVHPSATTNSAVTENLFDGVVSNFGALNCVRELRPVCETLARLVRPGGSVVICLISRFCLWETGFYALQGRFSKAGRRWRHRGSRLASVAGSPRFPIYYRSVPEIVGALRPEFRLRHHSGIGVFVPPSYIQPHVHGWDWLAKSCARLDRVFSSWPLVRCTADHAFLIFRREPPS